MKEWEARVLGFTSAWWMLAQALVPGPAPGLRAVLGMLALLVGALAALSVAGEVESRTGRTIANWFLLGIASMLALAVGSVVLLVVLSLPSVVLPG